MKDGKCPKCNSTEIMSDITVRDVGGSGPYPLRAAIQEPEPPKHGPFWVPREARGDLRAWICSQCGYTEIYANNLDELYNLYKLTREEDEQLLDRTMYLNKKVDILLSTF